MKKTLLSLIIIAASPNIYASTDEVKLTSSGICHDSNSGHYNRLKNFDSYPNMKSCFDDGGRAYKKYNPNTSISPSGKYDRKLYKHWIDSDKDCQDSRTEALISQSVSPIHFKTDRDCKAIKGTWNDPYTGNKYYNAIDLDIDHIVTLAWAHEHGASDMSPEMKSKFANDPINLIAVDKYLNRQKGAKPPMDWMPPNKAYHCQYVSRFQRVMITYKLKFTPEEENNFKNLKQKVCGR